MYALTGRVAVVTGAGSVHLFQPWAIIDSITADHRWTVDELSVEAKHFADVPFLLGRPY
jgi:hypothetical protein